MVRVSAPAIAMGAVGSFLNVTVGGAMSGLRNVFVLAVGGGVVVVVAGAFLPRLMRRAGRLFADYAFLSPLHPAIKLMKKGARAENKGARWKKDKAERLASRKFGPAPR